ncbi:hypothetical protein BJ741DRAFT_602484 [Chytriomyces cf. hyalinus JEL632]|nr:hypothetical protein BJ741DRAFT_602484 [Chytriomyces cf. hyalinus JEL632]
MTDTLAAFLFSKQKFKHFTSKRKIVKQTAPTNQPTNSACTQPFGERRALMILPTSRHAPTKFRRRSRLFLLCTVAAAVLALVFLSQRQLHHKTAESDKIENNYPQRNAIPRRNRFQNPIMGHPVEIQHVPKLEQVPELRQFPNRDVQKKLLDTPENHAELNKQDTVSNNVAHEDPKMDSTGNDTLDKEMELAEEELQNEEEQPDERVELGVNAPTVENTLQNDHNPGTNNDNPDEIDPGNDANDNADAVDEDSEIDDSITADELIKRNSAKRGLRLKGVREEDLVWLEGESEEFADELKQRHEAIMHTNKRQRDERRRKRNERRRARLARAKSVQEKLQAHKANNANFA